MIPILKEASQETKDITKAVVDERKLYLQALIVRIMKAKKSLAHKDLVNEVIQESMSNFVPTQVSIKGVIDDLVEKEYLARDVGESDMYNYLAWRANHNSNVSPAIAFFFSFFLNLINASQILVSVYFDFMCSCCLSDMKH